MSSERDTKGKAEPAAGGSAFPSTRWSLIAGAADDQSTIARKALAELCELYYYPLYTFAVRTGSKPQDAMDLTQGFFEFFLRTEAYSKADPQRGRLRSFLLASFKNYASAERRKQTAAKRGGGEEILALEPDENPALDPADDKTESPERAFDRAWARTVLALAAKALKVEHHAAGKQKTYEVLREFLSGDSGGRTYAEAAAELGITEGAARVAVYRMRQRLKDLFRQQVAETLEDPARVEEEIALLKQALTA